MRGVGVRRFKKVRDYGSTDALCDLCDTDTARFSASSKALLQERLDGRFSGDEHHTHLGLLMRDFFDPTPEEQNVVLVTSTILREVEEHIESCEHCNPTEIPFDNVLDHITDSDPSVTDYSLEQPENCPNCRRSIWEKTLVQLTLNFELGQHIDQQRRAGEPEFLAIF